MTLILGVKCSNGVVVGADGAATLGSLTLQTVMQPTSKLAVIAGKVILGVSGPIGLGQLYEDRLSQFPTECRDKNRAEACRFVRDALLQDLNVCLNTANLARQILGPAVAQEVAAQGLFAFAATLPARLDRQFDLLFDATLGNETVDAFLRDANPAAREAMAARFNEALRRDLWRPRRNSVAGTLRQAS